MHLMTSCHQTVCNQDSSLVSVPPQRKEFPCCSFWFLSLQGDSVHRYASTPHFCFSDMYPCCKYPGHHSVCQADFATGLGRIRMSELQHNARDVSHHLASLTPHVRASLPVPKT